MKFTTFVEKDRLRYEQPLTETGMPIFPQQIWRDAKLIPKTCPNFQMVDMGNGEKFASMTMNDGQTTYHLIEKYEKLILTRVEGTINTFGAKELKDIIIPAFDASLKSYDFFIYLDDDLNIKPISFGVGRPIINSMLGTITFTDEEFVEKIKNFKIRMTFVRYAGRKGMFGDTDCFDLPFRDDLKLLKSAKDNSSTASFEVQVGPKKHGTYILPPIDKGYFKNDNLKKNVLMTQENMNDIIHKIGVIDGGFFVESPDKDLTLKNGNFMLRTDK